MFNNCHISHILSCQNEPVKFADFCTTQVEIDVRLGLSSTLLELLSHGDRSYPGAPVFLHCALDTRESHRKPAAVGFMLRYAIAMYVYIYMNYAEDMSKLRESSEIYIALLFCMNVCHPITQRQGKISPEKSSESWWPALAAVDAWYYKVPCTLAMLPVRMVWSSLARRWKDSTCHGTDLVDLVVASAMQVS